MSGHQREGDDSLRTSEFVPAPGFGETGPPAAPESIASSTVVVPPTHYSNDVTSEQGAGQPHPATFPVPVVVGSGRSNSNGPIMAVLAVALLAIVGGAAALVTTNFGSFGGDDGTTGAPAASIEPVATPLPPTPPVALDVPVTVPPVTVPPETVPPETVPPETVPPETLVPGAAVPEAVPAPPPTPVPVAAINPDTGRGFGDLGLGQPVLAEPCAGGYVTFVLGVAGGSRPYPEQVQRGLNAFPGSNYIWGGMCPSLRQFNENGDEIYGVVYGPYASPEEACEVERRFASEGAYVRRLNTTDPVGRENHCG